MPKLLNLSPVSYFKIWLHCVWATKNRELLIPYNIRPILLNHIREYAESKSITLDYINAQPDHVHALIILGKDQNVSEIIRLIKGESSCWINKNHFLNSNFQWQDDFYAASVSHSHVDRVRLYIKNQDIHHRKSSLSEEFVQLNEKYRP